MDLLRQIFGGEFVTPQLVDVTYEWKVDNYDLIQSGEKRVSESFEVGKDLYALEVSKGRYLTVNLIQVKPREPASKFLCSVGIVDRQGKLLCNVIKEAEFGKGCETKEILNIPATLIWILKSKVIVNGTLSIQITFNLHTENDILTTFKGKRGLKFLSRDVGKLLKDKIQTDVELKVGSGIYKAHRLILSARSPVFAQMFASSSDDTVVNIVDVEPSIFVHVLYYIYTGKVNKGLTPSSASKLIRAADKYRLHELKSSCISFLANNLDMENVCDAILLAEKFGDVLLGEAAHEFVRKNAKSVIRSEQWKKFKAKFMAVANWVLSSILLTKKTTSKK